MLPVREEEASAEEDVGLVAREPLEAVEQGLVYTAGAELDDELVVVDALLLSIRRDGAMNVPRGDDLVMGGVEVGVGDAVCEFIDWGSHLEEI